MFTPLNAQGVEEKSRRVRADDLTVGRLRQLLAPPAGAEIDVWVERRITEVREYCRDFATMCRENGIHATWWGPDMLNPVPRSHDRKSAWAALASKVDVWRREKAAVEQRQRIQDARAERRQRQADVEQANRLSGDEVGARSSEVLAHLRGPTPAQIGLPAVLSRVASPARATNREAGERPELSEADEEQLRRRGALREAADARAEELEQHIRQRTHAAFAEYIRRHNVSPPPDIAEEIRRRIRAEEQETGT